MYIYRALDDSSRVTEEESLHLKDDSRVIQLEGHPATVVGIRFNLQSRSSSTQPAHQEGEQLAEVYGRDRDGTPQYWADKPNGICGGERARDAWREDLQARTASQRWRHCSCRIALHLTEPPSAFANAQY